MKSRNKLLKVKVTVLIMFRSSSKHFPTLNTDNFLLQFTSFEIPSNVVCEVALDYYLPRYKPISVLIEMEPAYIYIYIGTSKKKLQI